MKVRIAVSDLLLASCQHNHELARACLVVTYSEEALYALFSLLQQIDKLFMGCGCSDQDDEQSLLTTWQALGRFLKTHCSSADVYVLSGNSSVTHAMHMKADKKWPVSVGGIDCRIMHYHVLPPKTSRTLESAVKVPYLT